MNGVQAKARIIRVKISEGKEGLFYGTSPDLRGLLATGETLDALYANIPNAIADLFHVTGVDVIVSLAESNDTTDGVPWVAVPRLPEPSVAAA